MSVSILITLITITFLSLFQNSNQLLYIKDKKNHNFFIQNYYKKKWVLLRDILNLCSSSQILPSQNFELTCFFFNKQQKPHENIIKNSEIDFYSDNDNNKYMKRLFFKGVLRIFSQFDELNNKFLKKTSYERLSLYDIQFQKGRIVFRSQENNSQSMEYDLLEVINELLEEYYFQYNSILQDNKEYIQYKPYDEYIKDVPYRPFISNSENKCNFKKQDIPLYNPSEQVYLVSNCHFSDYSNLSSTVKIKHALGSRILILDSEENVTDIEDELFKLEKTFITPHFIYVYYDRILYCKGCQLAFDLINSYILLSSTFNNEESSRQCYIYRVISIYSNELAYIKRVCDVDNQSNNNKKVNIFNINSLFLLSANEISHKLFNHNSLPVFYFFDKINQSEYDNLHNLVNNPNSPSIFIFLIENQPYYADYKHIYSFFNSNSFYNHEFSFVGFEIADENEKERIKHKCSSSHMCYYMKFMIDTDNSQFNLLSDCNQFKFDGYKPDDEKAGLLKRRDFSLYNIPIYKIDDYFEIRFLVKFLYLGKVRRLVYDIYSNKDEENQNLIGEIVFELSKNSEFIEISMIFISMNNKSELNYENFKSKIKYNTHGNEMLLIINKSANSENESYISLCESRYDKVIEIKYYQKIIFYIKNTIFLKKTSQFGVNTIKSQSLMFEIIYFSKKVSFLTFVNMLYNQMFELRFEEKNFLEIAFLFNTRLACQQNPDFLLKTEFSFNDYNEERVFINDCLIEYWNIHSLNEDKNQYDYSFLNDDETNSQYNKFFQGINSVCYKNRILAEEDS